MQEKQKPSSSIVGRRMRERREALGLAQEKVGVAIGLDESSARARISRYELGVHEPPLATIRLLCETLGIPMTYLFCEEEDLAELLLLLARAPTKRRKDAIKSALHKLGSSLDTPSKI